MGNTSYNGGVVLLGLDYSSRWCQTCYFPIVAECSSLPKIKANIKSMVQLEERLETLGTKVTCVVQILFSLHPLLIRYETRYWCKLISKSKLCM